MNRDTMIAILNMGEEEQRRALGKLLREERIMLLNFLAEKYPDLAEIANSLIGDIQTSRRQ